MADQIREVQTVDVQLLNANRERPKTYKFDNPKANLTRAMVSEAFSPALANGWLLAADDTTAMYLGEVILNTSKKVTLDGEDFYVTPNSLTIDTKSPYTLTVTGAKVQGYNFKNSTFTSEEGTPVIVTISENGLTVNVMYNFLENGTVDLILIILGQEVTIPITVTLV